MSRPTAKVKSRNWFLKTVQTRDVANFLNEISESGHTVFTVNQSVSVGGSYEVIYFIERTSE